MPVPSGELFFTKPFQVAVESKFLNHRNLTVILYLLKMNHVLNGPHIGFFNFTFYESKNSFLLSISLGVLGIFLHHRDRE